MSELKKAVVKGAAWVMVEQLSTQAVGFVVTLILARLLSPSDYGTVALLSIFVAISSVLVDSGLGRALVQKKEATDVDFNSVFYLNVSLSVLMYFLLFALAPRIAGFYGVAELSGLLRVTALTLVINAINSIQNAELTRKLKFNLSFISGLPAVVCAGGVGVALAFFDYGPWALAWQSVTFAFVGMLVRWFVVAWRPRLMFSLSSVKGLWGYGWKMALSSLIDTGWQNLYGLIIGKVYTRADLAYVQKGNQVPSLLMTNINGTLGRVAFPVLAQMQDEKIRVRESMRRMICSSTFLVFPAMTLFAIVAPSAIQFLFGVQWKGAVIYAQFACFGFALWPFHTINLQAMQALGRSDLFLKLEIIKKMWGLLVLGICLPRGVLVFMAASVFISGPFGVLVNSWPNRKLLGYTVEMQLKDVAPSAFYSLVMALLTIPISFINGSYILIMFLQLSVGVAAYFLVSWLCNSLALAEFVKILRRQ